MGPRFSLRSGPLRCDKTGTPLAGAAGRVPRSLTRASCARGLVDVIKKETINMTIMDQIIELRTELRSCYFTKKERAEAKAELAALIAMAQAEDEHFARYVDVFLADLA